MFSATTKKLVFAASVVGLGVVTGIEVAKAITGTGVAHEAARTPVLLGAGVFLILACAAAASTVRDAALRYAGRCGARALSPDADAGAVVRWTVRGGEVHPTVPVVDGNVVRFYLRAVHRKSNVYRLVRDADEFSYGSEYTVRVYPATSSDPGLRVFGVTVPTNRWAAFVEYIDTLPAAG